MFILNLKKKQILQHELKQNTSQFKKVHGSHKSHKYINKTGSLAHAGSRFIYDGANMDIGPERALLAAILIRSINDINKQIDIENAIAFIESEYFEWLWDELCKHAQQMPDVDTARQMIFNGEVSVPKGAYH